jgi:hypothetical protein
MTRTDVMASSRPQAADAASITNRASGRARRLTVLLMALVALALAPAAALATGTTTGYNQEPPKPTTTSTTPSSGVAPSKESEKPTTTPASETAPTTTTAPSTEKALPFTGFDLRWEIGLGLLLIAGGLSIFLMQRRQRRAGGR